MTNLDPNDEANYMISNAEDLIEELESAIDDAVDELGDAQYVLEEAEQAFDNGDYDEAIEEAKAATQEVLDVLGVGDMEEAYDMDDESQDDTVEDLDLSGLTTADKEKLRERYPQHADKIY